MYQKSLINQIYKIIIFLMHRKFLIDKIYLNNINK